MKHDAEDKLRNYLRSKYMETADRITDDRDWRDGINQFRLRSYQDFEKIYKELALIQDKLNTLVDGDQVV